MSKVSADKWWNGLSIHTREMISTLSHPACDVWWSKLTPSEKLETQRAMSNLSSGQ